MENNYYMHDVKKILMHLIDIIRNEVAAGKAVRISGLGILDLPLGDGATKSIQL